MENNFLDLAKRRYSCRSFLSKEVEQDKIDKIIESARIAPTARNMQPIKIYCLKSKEAINKLQECKPQHFNETLAFILCYDNDVVHSRESDKKCYGDIDTSIIATHMMLEACDLGVESTMVMMFDPFMAKKIFNMPENIVPVSLLVMGYPAEDGVPSPRHTEKKSVDEIVEIL